MVEAAGACVAINGAKVWRIVILVDQLGVAPGEEILFEVGAVGMVADDTLAGVALARGAGGIIVGVGTGGYGEAAVEDIGYVVHGGVFGWDDFG